MSIQGITVGVRMPDGLIVDGTPEGLQIDNGVAYMTVKLKDGSIRRIKPPKYWGYSSDSGWYIN